MDLETTAGLTVAIALGVGMLAQSLALHSNIPAIVILLFAGALVGPDVAGWVRPDTLGEALPILVEFGVAVVLFEGGMNLDRSRLRREQRAIQMLVGVGALVTIVAATLTARWVLRWDWRPAALFGTLVVVTGPTVVTPLLRRIRIHSSVSTILEAEAVFGDAVGAVIAVVAYEFAKAPLDPGNVAHGAAEILTRLGGGAALGALGGFLLVGLLRFDRVVPRGQENVLALAFVLVLFQVSNALLHESGIAASITAGTIVGNFKTPVSHQLQEFKEGLTVMLIGLLFVLLAADVRLAQLFSLGVPGVVVVLILMFVVRPAAVFIATLGGGLSIRQRLFLSWLAPRGIIAASVASLFALGLEGPDMAGASSLREMVFLVILVTVCSAGLTGGWVAKLLELQRPQRSGWVILGASASARALATELQRSGQKVLCIDTNPAAARAAEEAGLKVVFGNGLEELTLRRVEVHAREGFVALTPNEEVNLLFSQLVRRYNKTAPVYVALDSMNEGVTPEMLDSAKASLLFGGSHRIERWTQRFEHGDVDVEHWRRAADSGDVVGGDVAGGDIVGGDIVGRASHLVLKQQDETSDHFLPLVAERKGKVTPVGGLGSIAEGDLVTFAIDKAYAKDVAARLTQHGWEKQAGARSRASLGSA